MAQKRAGEVDAFLSRPDTSFPIVLLYGPDPGLVSERAERVAALSGVDRADPFASVVLAADELERDIGRLFDEARTLSLFGGRRLIRVKGAGQGRNLADAVLDLAREPPPDALVVIEAGDLKKSSALRVNAERGRGSMVLPCYADEARALDAIIDEELAAAGLAIERHARDALKARLGANRLASRGEIQKLGLFARGQATVTQADVEAIVGDVSAETLDEAIDAASAGEVKKLPDLIERLVSSGTPPFQLHQGLLRHFQALQAMRAEVERDGTGVAAAAERRRPHFRRKAALETALGAWTVQDIGAALERIEADILQSRRESALAATVMQRTLIEIGVEAARLRRKR